MLTRLTTLWDEVRTSLWALPLAMVIMACGLAYGALHVNVDPGSSSVWFLFSGGSDQAPQFLSNLVTAMITMATLIVSITMVVLTLAAQQLGPRLIRSFMGDRRTQATLGLFVGTVVYLLLVLRSTYGKSETVANLAVTGGTTLVLLCVVALVLYVHHLAQSIIADNVIDRVGAQLDDDIARLLPEKTADQPDAPDDDAGQGAAVPLTYGGYVQAIDLQGIVDAAAKADAVVFLDIRAGQHAVPGLVAAHVVPDTADEDGALCKAVQSAIIVGRERTAVQDLEFSVRQLVEIALRALSPGINDPYTATAVVDRLTLSLASMMARGDARSVWEDSEGEVRLVAAVSTFEGVADEAFNQIRQQASPAVLIRMAECIGKLLQQADDRSRPPLERHLRLVVEAGRRNIAAEQDLAELQARADFALGNGARTKGRSRKRARR